MKMRARRRLHRRRYIWHWSAARVPLVEFTKLVEAHRSYMRRFQFAIFDEFVKELKV